VGAMIVVAILAGGSSTRFLGGDKLFYPIKGKPLIKYAIDSIMGCKNVLKVIAISSQMHINKIVEYIDAVQDPYQIGPLGAIYIALKMYREVFIIGGDMPYIDCRCIDVILNHCRDESSIACMPQYNSYLEPLLSIYRKPVLDIIEFGIIHDILSLQKLLNLFKAPIKTIDANNIDVLKRCLININTLDDLNRCGL
jgi:molybdopterin-guanine dinucleotide biosynthesis protein A